MSIKYIKTIEEAKELLSNPTEKINIYTTLEQQIQVYAKLGEEGKKRWESLFRSFDCFTEQEIALIKGGQK